MSVNKKFCSQCNIVLSSPLADLHTKCVKCIQSGPNGPIHKTDAKPRDLAVKHPTAATVKGHLHPVYSAVMDQKNTPTDNEEVNKISLFCHVCNREAPDLMQLYTHLTHLYHASKIESVKRQIATAQEEIKKLQADNKADN